MKTLNDKELNDGVEVRENNHGQHRPAPEEAWGAGAGAARHCRQEVQEMHGEGLPVPQREEDAPVHGCDNEGERKDEVTLRAGGNGGGGGVLDEELQDGEKAACGNIGAVKGSGGDMRGPRPGRKPKKAPAGISNPADAIGVVHRLIPNFNETLGKLADPRGRNRITYDLAGETWAVILQRLGISASARDWDNVRHGGFLRENINMLSGCSFTHLPHSDTVKYLLEKIDPAEFNKVLASAFIQLRNARRLDAFRVSGQYLVAVDGVEFNSANHEIPHSCHRKLPGGQTEYFQVALVAYLVTLDNIWFPIWVEFIENPEGEYDKQDCEYKAALRLLPDMKKAFPLQQFCLLMDGLYLKAGVMNIITGYGWDYVITWRDGSAPVFSRKAHSKIRQYPKNRLRQSDSAHLEDFECAWANRITHIPAGGKDGYTANVLEAVGKFEYSQGRTTKFAYVTSRKITKENALPVLRAGRARWGMETGNNVQKHSELNLESPYGMRGNTSLSYCMLVMVASLVRCLMGKTNYFDKILLKEGTGGTSGNVAGALKKAYNSTMAFMRAVCDSLRNSILNLCVLPAGVHVVFSSA